MTSSGAGATLRHATTLTPGLCSTVAHSSSSSPQEAETGSEKATTISTTSGPSVLRVAVSRSFGGIPPPPLCPNTVPAMAPRGDVHHERAPERDVLVERQTLGVRGTSEKRVPGFREGQVRVRKDASSPGIARRRIRSVRVARFARDLNPPSTLGGDAPSAPRAAQMPPPAVAFRSIWNLLTSAPQRGDASQMVFQSRRFSAIPASAGSAKTLCSAFHAAKTSASTPSAAASPTPSSRT